MYPEKIKAIGGVTAEHGAMPWPQRGAGAAKTPNVTKSIHTRYLFGSDPPTCAQTGPGLLRTQARSDGLEIL